MSSQIPDFGKIMKMAQEVASKIEAPESLKSGQLSQEDMTDVLGKISKSVGEMITPEMLTGEFNAKEKTTGNPKKNKGKSKIKFSSSDLVDITGQNESKSEKPSKSDEKPSKSDEKPSKSDEKPSKSDEKPSKSDEKPSKSDEKLEIKRKKRYVEIESTDEESDEDPTIPRTKDMTFTLSVTLDELFTGAKKKLALRRQKLDTDGSYEEEKKKLSIKIEPGMIEEQVIRFNHMADEKQGYDTGDVVVTLDVEDHTEFTRIGNDLIIEREISFAEAYSPIVYIKHLNGKNYKITGPPIEIFNNLDEELLKKIPGLGMPVHGETKEFGDLYIKFTCVNKTKITKEILQTLISIFPPLVKPFVVKEGEDIIEEEFEMVTESDLEYLESSCSESESDSDSDYDSEESETDSDEEESEKEEESENIPLCKNCDEEEKNKVDVD